MHKRSGMPNGQRSIAFTPVVHHSSQESRQPADLGVVNAVEIDGNAQVWIGAERGLFRTGKVGGVMSCFVSSCFAATVSCHARYTRAPCGLRHFVLPCRQDHFLRNRFILVLLCFTNSAAFKLWTLNLATNTWRWEWTMGIMDGNVTALSHASDGISCCNCLGFCAAVNLITLFARSSVHWQRRRAQLREREWRI